MVADEFAVEYDSVANKIYKFNELLKMREFFLQNVSVVDYHHFVHQMKLMVCLE